MEYRMPFDNFKSEICHRVKYTGDDDQAYINVLIASDDIRKYFEKQWYPESLYLLAMLDYLCRVNNLPLYSEYDDLRRHKLKNIIYPSSIIALSTVLKDESIKTKSFDDAIPEFKRFNIVENEIRNVV